MALSTQSCSTILETHCQCEPKKEKKEEKKGDLSLLSLFAHFQFYSLALDTILAESDLSFT